MVSIQAVLAKLYTLFQFGDTSLGIEPSTDGFRLVLLRRWLHTVQLISSEEISNDTNWQQILPKSDYINIILPHERMMLKRITIPVMPLSEINSFLQEQSQTLFPFRPTGEASIIRWQRLKGTLETIEIVVILLRQEQVERAAKYIVGSPIRISHWLFGMKHMLKEHSRPCKIERADASYYGNLLLHEDGALDFTLEQFTEQLQTPCAIDKIEPAKFFTSLEKAYWPAASSALGAFYPSDGLDLRSDTQRRDSEELFFRHLTKKIVLLSGIFLLISAALFYIIQFTLLHYQGSLEAKLLNILPQSQELKSLETKLEQLDLRYRGLIRSSGQNSTLALHLVRLTSQVPSELWFTDISFQQEAGTDTKVILNALAPNPTYLSLLLEVLNSLKEVHGARLVEMEWKSVRDIYRKWAVRHPKNILLTVEYDVRNIVEVD